MPELVVLGGDFAGASMTLAHRVVSYEPVTGTCTPLGAGVDGPVEAFAVLPNGDLVVAGAFANAGSVAASRVARWNGATWSALGTGIAPGLNVDVRACVTMPNGDLIALSGLTFYLQFFDLDSSGPGWVGTHSTNALACTVGSL